METDTSKRRPDTPPTTRPQHAHDTPTTRPRHAQVLDHLGATFAPVARELRKNADKLAAAARRLSPERTLRALVAREVREGACVRGEAAKEGSAALALLWLCRQPAHAARRARLE